MGFALKEIAVSSTCCSLPKSPAPHFHLHKGSKFPRQSGYGNQWNDAVLISSSSSSYTSSRGVVCAVGGAPRMTSVESLFCYDKPIPEQIIEKPVGLSLAEKNIGGHSPCSTCQIKGVILCATCSGTGLYVDSIMESQGIIVKVRCLGCGGTGNTMCSECGGRGHI